MQNERRAEMAKAKWELLTRDEYRRLYFMLQSYRDYLGEERIYRQERFFDLEDISEEMDDVEYLMQKIHELAKEIDWKPEKRYEESRRQDET
jgi:hypothetical protein